MVAWGQINLFFSIHQNFTCTRDSTRKFSLSIIFDIKSLVYYRKCDSFGSWKTNHHDISPLNAFSILCIVYFHSIAGVQVRLPRIRLQFILDDSADTYSFRICSDYCISIHSGWDHFSLVLGRCPIPVCTDGKWCLDGDRLLDEFGHPLQWLLRQMVN